MSGEARMPPPSTAERTLRAERGRTSARPTATTTAAATYRRRSRPWAPERSSVSITRPYAVSRFSRGWRGAVSLPALDWSPSRSRIDRIDEIPVRAHDRADRDGDETAGSPQARRRHERENEQHREAVGRGELRPDRER